MPLVDSVIIHVVIGVIIHVIIHAPRFNDTEIRISLPENFTICVVLPV
jgi:hypothetical protein